MRNANFMRAILIGLPFGAHHLYAEFLFLRCETETSVAHEKFEKRKFTRQCIN